MTKLKKIDNYLVHHPSRPARFYILPRIDKNKDNLPGRPIVSASSHPTERISEFVDYQLNPLVSKLPSYVKDTTHSLDSLPELPNSCLFNYTGCILPVYQYTPTKKEFTPAEKLSNHVIRMILTMNNFEFENNHYLQLQWTQKWHLPTPTFSWVILNSLISLKPLVWWRYINDVFMIWPQGEEKLNEFVNLLNSCH